MVKIVRQIASRNTKRYWGKNPAKYITIHETANEHSGATAQAHANGLSRNAYGGSWHWSVDDQQAIQSLEHTVQAWHAGDGRRSGNLESIGIEICEEGNDASDRKAYANAAELTAVIMKQENIPLSRVVQHNKWSGKNCPNDLRKGGKGVTWSQFLDMVEEAYKTGSATLPGSDGVKPVDTTPNSKYPLLTVDGAIGTKTITRWQESEGTPIDGEIWYQNVKYRDIHTALTSGVKWGSYDWAKKGGGSSLIKAATRQKDGILGYDGAKDIQKDLASKGYYSLSIDGKIEKGKATATGLQRYLNDKAQGKAE